MARSRAHRAICALVAVSLLAGCASRDDFLAACGGSNECADQMATAKNNETAGEVATVVLAVGAIALLVAAAAAGGVPPSAPAYQPRYTGPRYPDVGCGSRGGPGWRRADGRCASWQDN